MAANPGCAGLVVQSFDDQSISLPDIRMFSIFCHCTRELMFGNFSNYTITDDDIPVVAGAQDKLSR